MIQRKPNGLGHGLSIRKRRGAEKDLRIGTWNIKTLCGKEVELIEEMLRYKVDLIGISEVKKKGSGEVELDQGFTLVYSGVPKGTHAKEGVGILMSGPVYSKLEDWRAVSPRIIVANLQLSVGKVALIQVYAPVENAALVDKEMFYSDLERTVNQCRENNRKLILLGDFNARTGWDHRRAFGVMGPHGGENVKNENGQRLIDFCIDYGLLIGNSFYPHKRVHKITFSSEGGNSVIDYFLYDRDLRHYFTDVKVIRGAELSTDHLLLVADTRILRERKNRSKVYERIDVNALSSPETREEYNRQLEDRMRSIYVDGDVEELWKDIKVVLLDVAKSVCGMKKVNTRGKRTKWWSETIKEVIAQKKAAWKSYMSNRTPENWCAYVVKRNEAKAAVREAKRISWEEFGKSLNEDYNENIKKFWKKVKSLRGKKGKDIRNIKDINGNVLTNPEQVLERWRRHYERLFAHSESCGALAQNVDSHLLEEDVIWEEDVERALEKVKVGKAAGNDNIAPEFVKYGGPELIKALQALFQKIWDAKRIPKDWEINIIIPIHKKGSTAECENYRPICLSPVVYKIYTSILEYKLRSLVESDLEEEQAGFRPGRQTQDHIFVLRSILEKAWDRDKDMYLAFLDLKSAFDSVPRDYIWQALRAKSVPDGLIAAIKSTYQSPKGLVRIGGHTSKPFRLDQGVKQGDSLSPLLFILYMDEIHKVCKRRTGRAIIGYWNMRAIQAQAYLYADDVVLVSDTKEKLQQAVVEWQEELARKGMLINTSKSRVLVLSRDEEPENVQVFCSGKILEATDVFPYLGTLVSKSGKIDLEISNRISKANQIYYQICNSIVGKREVAKEAKLAVFKMVFLPVLTYGSESWTALDRHLSRITAAEMRFLRRVAGKTRRDLVRNETIRESLGVPALKDSLHKRQLQWFGHVCRMSEDRDPRKVMEARPQGKRPRGRPRIQYLDHIERLGQGRGKTLREMRQLAQDRGGWQKWLGAPPR